jgi:hypothetical protein
LPKLKFGKTDWFTLLLLVSSAIDVCYRINALPHIDTLPFCNTETCGIEDSMHTRTTSTT